MNEVLIKGLSKIRSYQTLIIKNGRYTYPGKHHETYRNELINDIEKLKPIEFGNPIKIELTFYVMGAIKSDLYNVIDKYTKETLKSYKSLKNADKWHDSELHDIEFSKFNVSYGSIPDFDNASKFIVDLLEEFGIIENDRFATEVNIKRKFGYDENMIRIRLEKVDVEDYIKEGS